MDGPDLGTTKGMGQREENESKEDNSLPFTENLVHTSYVNWTLCAILFVHEVPALLSPPGMESGWEELMQLR